MIARAGANTEIACLTDEQVAELGVPREPEWLHIYADKREPGPHHAAWAMFYNHIGAGEKALAHVRAAREAGYASRDLSYQHGFALNALGRFAEAIEVLDPAVKGHSDDPEMTGELAFACLKAREFRRAVELCESAIATLPDDRRPRKAEFANNLAIAYNSLGDEKNAEKWRKQSKAWKNER